jgi:DNA-binding response OmpR family regulator
MRALIVEDDPLLGQGIMDALDDDGHRCEWVMRGMAAVEQARLIEFDIVVLDLGLPDIDGFEVIKRLRAAHISTPILILTARDTSSEKVIGLDAGADDYMVKPFDLPELLARLRALHRRLGQNKSSEVQHGGLVINQSSRTVMQDGTSITLSRHEFDLLSYLLHRPDQVFSREALVDKLYSWDQEVGSNTVEVYVHHLRKKLGKGVIKTVRGIGYQLGQIGA